MKEYKKTELEIWADSQGEIKDSVSIIEYEYREKDWEMWVEGTSDKKPDQKEIVNHARSKGYSLTNVEIFCDSLQGLWRFRAELVIINRPRANK